MASQQSMSSNQAMEILQEIDAPDNIVVNSGDVASIFERATRQRESSSARESLNGNISEAGSYPGGHRYSFRHNSGVVAPIVERATRQRESSSTRKFFDPVIAKLIIDLGFNGYVKRPSRLDCFHLEFNLWKLIQKHFHLTYPDTQFDHSIWGNYFPTSTKLCPTGLKKSGKVLMMHINEAMKMMSPNADGVMIYQTLIISGIKIPGATYFPSHVGALIATKCSHNQFQYYYYETMEDRPMDSYSPMKFVRTLKGLTNFNKLHIIFGTQRDDLACYHYTVDFMSQIAAGKFKLFNRELDVYNLYGESSGNAALLEKQFIGCCGEETRRLELHDELHDEFNDIDNEKEK